MRNETPNKGNKKKKNEITITGLGNNRTPQWVINMAREYARNHGLQTVSLDEFYDSPEYASSQTKSLSINDRINLADTNEYN